MNDGRSFNGTKDLKYKRIKRQAAEILEDIFAGHKDVIHIETKTVNEPNDCHFFIFTIDDSCFKKAKIFYTIKDPNSFVHTERLVNFESTGDVEKEGSVVTQRNGRLDMAIILNVKPFGYKIFSAEMSFYSGSHVNILNDYKIVLDIIYTI